MANIIRRELEFAGQKLVLESGLLVPQANGAVKASYGETTILATAVTNDPRDDYDFFPLRVDYEEKLYAGGMIKSSRFVKRAGRPRDEAIIAARLTDHAIRPLFPKDFMDETHVVMTTLSIDKERDPVVLAMVAVSATLASSNIPWNGPMATVRVGRTKEGELVLNPDVSSFEELDLNLVISYLENDKVLAMEAEANNLPDELVLEAIKWGSQQIKPLLEFIKEFAKAVGKTKYEYESQALDEEMVTAIKDFAGDKLKELITAPLNKVDWKDAYGQLREEVWSKFEGTYTKSNMSRALEKVQKKMVRSLILDDNKRTDGRAFDEVRELTIQAGVLPRVHGTGFFQRGLTQVLTIVTLASGSLEQIIQDLYGEHRSRYFHHYNAPPYSTGEAGSIRGAGRREIGHGALAEKALYPVLPKNGGFPYTIHLVSEVLSQNGSSSMASACGSSLALMDAGVPISAHVGGVSVGLVTDPDKQDKFVVLTDIAGTEDFSGFMDYKMTGTKEGVTAIQMDIKLPGIPLDLFDKIFAQSKAGRLEILDSMYKAIAEPRAELSRYAPKITCVQIDPDKIGTVIGSGGRTIKEITEKTGCELNVDESGEVQIVATDENANPQAAADWVAGLVKEVEIGEVYEGVVVKIADFGAFINILPGKDGLLHISEIAHRRLNRVEDELHEGDLVKVKVIGKDRGKVSLSRKELLPRPQGSAGASSGGNRPNRSRGYRGSGGSSGDRRPQAPKRREYHNRRY